jgi:uncharacterized protein (UPF0548 family)
MFCLSRPSPDSIRSFILAQKTQPFSYEEVGASRYGAPRGYTVDHNRIKLGQGTAAFERAKNAIRQWKMFEMSWIHLCWPDAPIEVGTTVAVLVSHYGFWSLNAARVVYFTEEHGALERYGFAYGTLREHGEIGEERFLVELNRADESVAYDLYAFSRPGWTARLAYPLSRNLQQRFAKESLSSMVNAIQFELRNG